MVKRRDFIRTAGLTGMAVTLGGPGLVSNPVNPTLKNQDILKNLEDLTEQD